MPERALLHRRVAALLLVTAYVLLVGTVVLGGWWLQRQFDQAEKDRCALAVTQLELTTIEISILAKPTDQLTPIIELDPELQAHLDQLRAVVVETCPGYL